MRCESGKSEGNLKQFDRFPVIRMVRLGVLAFSCEVHKITVNLFFWSWTFQTIPKPKTLVLDVSYFTAVVTRWFASFSMPSVLKRERAVSTNQQRLSKPKKTNCNVATLWLLPLQFYYNSECPLIFSNCSLHMLLFFMSVNPDENINVAKMGAGETKRTV